jgi:outer membrane protein assembly factor BamB
MPMIEPRRRNDPEQVGNFRVIGRLGAGGFGKVYVASGLERSGELVAVKVMQSELAGDPDFRDRFAREIRAIDRVSSDYVPRLKGHGADDEALWLATELVRGPSLHHVVRRSGPLPERTVWCLALGIATALNDIHGAGLVHRDLKPGNVLLVPDRPRIIDFGLAHLTGADHQTASGLPMCSPEYAPPEQRRSLGEAHEPADVFTLGGTLLFAATGHPPYGRGRVPSMAPPNLADLPSSLYDVIAQCLCDAEDARPILADLIAYSQLRSGAVAGGDGLAFASVLTARITDVINAWQRELDEVVRLAAAGRTAGPRGNSRGPGWPAPGGGSTSPLTDAVALTEMFGRNRDGGRITVPEPALARSRPVSGQGADVRWKRGLGDWVRAPVAVVRDRVVAVSLSGVVACFAARSGNLLGHANLGVPVRSPVLPPEATSTSWAYAGGADGVLYAIDLASGYHWALFYASSAIEGPPVTVADHIYALSADGCVWEVDARASSEPALVCDLGGPALGTLTVADGTIIAASAEGCVYAIDPADRTIRWRRPTGGLVFGAPAVGAGWLYIAGTDGRLWSVRIDGSQHATLDIGVPVHAALVHDHGRLYVGGADGRVRAFNISDSFAAEPTLLWTSPEIGGEVGGIAARGGTVVATAGRTLTVLDGASGNRRAWSSAGTLITAAPVMIENLIYVASLDGTVSCLSMASLPVGSSNSLLKWHKFRLGRNSRIPVPSA